MGFSRQEYWSGQPFPSPGDLSDSGTELGSPVWHADCLLTEPIRKPQVSRESAIHMHLFSLSFPFRLPQSIEQEILVLDSRFSIIAYFTHSLSSVSASIPTSQSTPCPLPHWYTFVPYVWVSISALQMRSSTPVFPDSRLYMLIETKRDFFYWFVSRMS